MAFDELIFHNRLARPGTILDVGANKGTMTLHFATWTQHKTVAFEPFPPIYDQLVKNIHEGFGGEVPDRVSLRREAVGDVPGRATLRIPRTKSGVIDEWASLAKSFEGFQGVTYDEVEVPVVTIDSLDLPDLTAMKLDAEGFEQEVLLGARRSLRACRPIVSVECEERHREGCTYFIPGLMAGLDFDGYWYNYRDDEFRPISAFDRRTLQQASASPAEEKYGETYIFQFYFIPRENYELHLRLADCAPIRA